MRKSTRIVVTLALSSLLASLLAIASAGTARATEVVPDLQWPAVDLAYSETGRVTSPQGDFTLTCVENRQDLTTYNSVGMLTRQVDRDQQIDGVENCIQRAVVDQQGVLYGIPYGENANGSVTYGPNLLAYDGDTLKWKYPVGCGARPEIGADGNIYLIDSNKRLIGLTPDWETGQTQPEKILDISVGGKCGDSLRAFDDGIAVIWSSGAYITYYTYDGTLIGQASGTYTADRRAAINASGQLFYTTRTNSYRDLNLSVYDPFTKSVLWTVRVYRSDYTSITFRTYPLPSGGAIVTIKGQDPNSGGTIATLVTVTADGQVLRTTQLPRTDAEGDIFGSDNYYAADTTGKFVVARSKQVAIDDDPGVVRNTEVIVFDTVTGDTLYQEEIKGNVDPEDGDGSDEAIYGYRPIGYNYDIAIGPNAAYLYVEKCWGDLWNGCSDTYPDKVLPLRILGLGLDYPRGVVLGETINPPIERDEYIALGDSFSSGEGVKPYEEGTAEPGVNVCHRSTMAYPQLLEQRRDLTLRLDMQGFRACSGAETQHITSVGWEGEDPQSEYLSSETDVVTLTIGGNDIGFGEFAEACVLPGTQHHCNFSSAAYADAFDKINNELPAKLLSTYELVLQEAPNAEIYVLGYPHVAPEKTSADPMDPRCPFLYYSGYDTMNAPVLWEDAQAARDVVMRINSHIESIIWGMREEGGENLRLHYVEVNGIGSPFEGHEMCSSGDSFFQNLDQWPENDRAPFHPNEQGQAAYAELVAAAMLENAG